MVLDWNEYCELARWAVAEGVVLLVNDNNVLPLRKDSNIAVFGRIQTHYYKSGTGSGGMVNVSKVTGILDALLECPDIAVNQELLDYYKVWEETHPFNEGMGWGHEPWSQEEMPVSDELVKGIAAKTDTALVIIGRTAGEEQDNRNIPGAYQLSAEETDMFSKVRSAFKNMIVVLNVGSIMDMSFVDQFHPDAVLYGWQGGMVGGLGTVDVLTGKVSPSGKLSDTIARSISDYPSDACFGDHTRNFYTEDIYVGYRYFETAATDKVQFPFGFGLSYTEFKIQTVMFEKTDDPLVKIKISVQNTGTFPGKEVVQIYTEAPQGNLGKPLRSLVAFRKTMELKPGETQYFDFVMENAAFASYDDSGVTGYKSCYVLEAGTYHIFAGNSVRSLENLLIAIKDEFEKKEDGYQLLFTSLFYEFLHELYKNHSVKLSIHNKNKAAKNLNRIEQIMDYVKSHYQNPITLDEISGSLSITSEYFCRLFKKYTNQTFLEYVNTVRLVHIYYDLIHSNDSITYLMDKNGITNYKVFIRMFKEAYGTTPIKIRSSEKIG